MVEETDIHEQVGPVLLLAGPGTGKTTRLAKRIKFLVENRCIDPQAVSVVTFTSAASAEMRSRISDSSERARDTYVEARLRPENIQTMHSLGYSIIRAAAETVGLPERPKVVSEDDVRDIVIADAARLEGHGVREAKDAGRCRQIADCADDGQAKCTICARYCAILRACGAIDFDGQLLLAARILRDHEAVKAEFRKRAQHLLVDEYQDINAAQKEIIRSLSEGALEGLFVVGDDDQSIYSWRGGTPTFIRGFEADFACPGATTPLRECYRSAEHVFEGASAVVARFDPGRLDKGEIHYAREAGAKIQVHEVPSEGYEATEVVRIVEQAESRSVLILYPNKRIARAVLAKLRSSGVDFEGPVPEPGKGLWLLDRLFSWLSDPDDNLALRVCLQAMADSGELGIPSPAVRKAEKRAAREAALRAVAGLWHQVLEGRGSLWDSLQRPAPQDASLTALLNGCIELRSSADIGGVTELLTASSKLLKPWASVGALADEIADWVGGLGRPGGANNVRVLSLQKSKGLEADIVCMLGAEEGVLPREGASGADLAEQARLFYVAMTRAREQLHIFYARKRTKWATLGANAGGSYSPPARSRFIDVIPGEHVEYLQKWPSRRK